MVKKSSIIKITLVRSPIAALPKHKACLRGLGLRRMHHSVKLVDSPCVRGIINKISHLLSVEEA